MYTKLDFYVFLNSYTFFLKYLLQLEVNPNLHVPEISYDNNGMTCKLQYTGYYARITDCKLISIL